MSERTNEEIVASLVSPDAEQEARFTMDEDYQRLIISMLLSDRQFLTHSIGLVQPTYFTNDAHRTICRVLFDHFDQYKIWKK